MDLVEALKDHEVVERDRRIVGWLLKAVEQGLWPFKPQPIHLHMDFDLDYQTYRILVELPSINLYFKFHVDRDLLFYEDTLFIWDATATRIFHTVRNRETLPILSTIELGEN